MAVRISLAKARALLAYLAMRPNGTASRHELTSLLWSERSETQARQSFRQTLKVLKSELAAAGLDIVCATDDTVRLSLDQVDVDALALRASRQSPDQFGADSDGAGEFLAGTHLRDPVGDAWICDRRREMLEAGLRQVMAKLASAMHNEDLARGEQLAVHALSLDPTVEAAHQALMLIAIQRGERHLALRQYQTCREILAGQLEVLPSPETERLRLTARARPAEAGKMSRESRPAFRQPDSRRYTDLWRAGSPSLVIAPWRTPGGSRRAELLAFGLADDIVVDLSRMAGLTVLPTATAMTVARDSEDPLAIGRALSVRYVLQGSLELRERSDEIRVRVTAVLVDVERGQNIWAERYDRSGDDFWTIRDDLSRRIAATSLSAAETIELNRIRSSETTRAFGPWELCVLAKHHFLAYGKEANRKSRELYARALELDPGSARAVLGIGWTHLEDYCFGWGDDPAASLAAAEAAASEAISTNAWRYSAHYLSSYTHLIRRRFEQACDAIDLARTENPSDPELLLHKGYVVSCSGVPDAGLEWVTAALASNPLHPNWHHFIAGSVALDGERPLLAAGELTRFIGRHQGPIEGIKAQAVRSRAAALALAGDLESAAHDRARFMKANPAFRLARLRQSFVRKDPTITDRYVRALALAGFPG